MVKDDAFLLTDDSHYKRVRALAERYLAEDRSEEELWHLAGEPGLFEALAAFLAISRLKLRLYKNRPLRIAVLMNLIHEQNRLRPSSPGNPNGENALENKLAQLDWLFGDTEVDYRLIYVSGICPWGSDEILDAEIRRTGTRKVSHLVIPDSGPGSDIIRNRKGGEMIFGIRSILRQSGYPDEGPFDCMLLTDADMTLDLGQLGITLEGYFSGRDLIIGNRMEPRSVLVKNMTRAGSGVLMFRHLQRKLAPVFFEDLDLHDTQCPWKFLSRRVMADIAGELDSMDWSVDTDILSAAAGHGYGVNIVPVTAIDSELESHGRAVGHYRRNRTIIEGTLHQARKYGLRYDREIARLVETYLRTDEDYRKLLESGLPPEIRNLPNREWGRSPLITLSLVEAWLKQITSEDPG